MISKDDFILLSLEFAERADEANDAADHDEMHAASDVCAILTVKPWMQTPYIERWVYELRKRIIAKNLTSSSD